MRLNFLAKAGRFLIRRVLPNLLDYMNIAEILGGLLKPGQKTGPAKKKAVKEFIKQAFLESEELTGKDIADNALFDEGVDQIVEGTFKVTQAFQKV